MFTEQEILEIIKQKIESEEKLGHQSGGSGHMGYVSYKLTDFETRKISPELLEITYRYSVFVETEFTYYPDNPPMAYHYKRVFVVNRDKEILPET